MAHSQPFPNSNRSSPSIDVNTSESHSDRESSMGPNIHHCDSTEEVACHAALISSAISQITDNSHRGPRYTPLELYYMSKHPDVPPAKLWQTVVFTPTPESSPPPSNIPEQWRQEQTFRMGDRKRALSRESCVARRGMITRETKTKRSKEWTNQARRSHKMTTRSMARVGAP